MIVHSSPPLIKCQKRLCVSERLLTRFWRVLMFEFWFSLNIQVTTFNCFFGNAELFSQARVLRRTWLSVYFDCCWTPLCFSLRMLSFRMKTSATNVDSVLKNNILSKRANVTIIWSYKNSANLCKMVLLRIERSAEIKTRFKVTVLKVQWFLLQCSWVEMQRRRFKGLNITVHAVNLNSSMLYLLMKVKILLWWW